MARSSAVQPDLPVFPHGRSPVPAPVSARGRAFVRLFVELQTMQHSRVGVTLEQLAAETGVTTRTVRRDLEVLQEVGVPLVDEFDHGANVRPVRRWRVMNRDLCVSTDGRRLTVERDIPPAAMRGAR